MLKTVRDVLAYFLQNPSTTDNLEGIARWRVQQETVPHIVEQVDRALAWLVDHQLLVREERVGVAPMFRLDPARAVEAEQLLRDIEDRAGAPDVEHGEGRARVVEHPSPLWTKALAWIDAVLLRYHRHHGPGSDLPGLTRSHASVDSALAPRLVEASPAPRAEHDEVGEANRELDAALESAPDDEPLAILSRNLGLTALEFRTVLLCLAPEVDAKYQAVYGVLNDDLGRRTVTLGLACAVLGDPPAIRFMLAESSGLARWSLLEHGAALPYADHPLRLDAALVAWLLGDEGALAHDPRLAAVLHPDRWRGAEWIATADGTDAIGEVMQALATDDRQWIVLAGGDLDGSKATIDAACIESDRALMRLPLSRIARPDITELREIAARVARAAQLGRAVVAIDASPSGESSDISAALRSLIDALSGTPTHGVIVAADVQHVIGALPADRVRVLSREAYDSTATAATIAAAADAAGLRIARSDAERLALAFPLPVGAISEAAKLAVLEGADTLEPNDQAASLAAALRRIASPDLPRFARSIDPAFDLNDVVLPTDRHRQLHEMVAHVRYAYHVLFAWGFNEQLAYGRGVTALFCGPSGTGKTMAAQAIARELGTRAYMVDLSRVVSKYIGQTEANLDAVFNDAERAGAVLLFDEADALFGKRSEIKDSHDRYANIEVAYLLQRMEAFTGLAILTTNFRRNLDDAFMRRIRFVVEFPKPDATAREAIWKFCLPAAAPLASDVNVRLLARRLELTGGSIRQITIRAAFAAAADGASAIAMHHIVAATRAELLKLGMTSSERDLSELEAATQHTSTRVA